MVTEHAGYLVPECAVASAVVVVVVVDAALGGAFVAATFAGSAGGGRWFRLHGNGLSTSASTGEEM